MEQYDDKTLAEALLEAMKIKGFSVEKLSLTTGVSERILELLLAERFDELPPAPYVRGYLMKIAEALGVDGQILWDAYGKYHREIRRSGHHDTLPENRFALPKISRRLLAGIVVALLVVGFAASRFFGGAQTFVLEVNITEEAITASSTYLLSGNVRAGDQLTVNGVPLTLNQDGSFERSWELVPGWNTLTFLVRRPLGGEREFVKQIFYESPTTTDAIETSTESQL